MPTIETTLYYAHWCGHCKTFEPQWDEFSSQVEKNNGKLGEISIRTNKYEESSLKNQQATINGKPIRGYPTVKIKVSDDDGNTVEYEYSGKRLSTALIDHMKNHALGNLNKNDEDMSE